MVSGTVAGDGDTAMEPASRASSGPVEKVEAVGKTASDHGRILRFFVHLRGGNVTWITDRGRSGSIIPRQACRWLSSQNVGEASKRS